MLRSAVNNVVKRQYHTSRATSMVVGQTKPSGKQVCILYYTIEQMYSNDQFIH